MLTDPVNKDDSFTAIFKSFAITTWNHDLESDFSGVMVPGDWWPKHDTSTLDGSRVVSNSPKGKRYAY